MHQQYIYRSTLYIINNYFQVKKSSSQYVVELIILVGGRVRSKFFLALDQSKRTFQSYFLARHSGIWAQNFYSTSGQFLRRNPTRIRSMITSNMQKFFEVIEMIRLENKGQYNHHCFFELRLVCTNYYYLCPKPIY